MTRPDAVRRNHEERMQRQDDSQKSKRRLAVKHHLVDLELHQYAFPAKNSDGRIK
jgi:hypothetical protein